jgi:hypothetical protein
MPREWCGAGRQLASPGVRTGDVWLSPSPSPVEPVLTPRSPHSGRRLGAGQDHPPEACRLLSDFSAFLVSGRGAARLCLRKLRLTGRRKRVPYLRARAARVGPHSRLDRISRILAVLVAERETARLFDAVAADPAARRNLHGRSPRNGPPVRGTRRRARLVTRREDDRVRDELRYMSRNPVRQNVTPRLAANRCGAPGSSGPPVWSPDGTKLAAETTHKHGIYAMDKRGGGLQWVSLGLRETRTWYRRLPGRPSWRPTH